MAWRQYLSWLLHGASAADRFRTAVLWLGLAACAIAVALALATAAFVLLEVLL